MGLFNWIWRTLQTLSVFACIVGLPGKAGALGTSNGVEMYTTVININCSVVTQENSDQGTATEDCGQGLSLGFKANSNDGLLNLTAKAGMDRIGSETTSTLRLQFEQKF